MTPKAFFKVSNLSCPFRLPAPNSSSDDSETSRKPWQHVAFEMNRGDVVLVQGPSGSGKTTLLKSLADLIPLDEDGEENAAEVKLLDLTSTYPEISPSVFRSRVSYIPQRPSLYPGSPLDFFNLVSGFDSNRKDDPLPVKSGSSSIRSDEEAQVETGKGNMKGQGWRLIDAKEVFSLSPKSDSNPQTPADSSDSNSGKDNQNQSNDFTIQSLGYPIPSDPNLPSPNLGPDPLFFSAAYWNLPTRVWRSDWSQISGGEAQRVGLAIGLAMKIRQKGEGILLLDEPTSALDLQTTRAIERTLLLNPTVLTIVWITHSDDQTQRVAELIQLDNDRRRARSNTDGSGDRKVRILYLGDGI